ncbi:MAG: 2-C-methyl-D-erythritol 4-phosphate cytidylyltransferase [Planctomycetota bacterium]|nr:2-C-methyl-D-erythritol 4-phosphate cytidylyltransferase [Planctomycetota bacterium]
MSTPPACPAPHPARPPRAPPNLLAAGESTRMGNLDGKGDTKPFIELAGRTVLEHACRAFDACDAVAEIVIVCRAQDLARVQLMSAERAALAKVVAEVPGGAERTDSVRAGVAVADYGLDVILVHDVARPLVTPETIGAVIERAAECGAALAATAVTDTIKTSSDGLRAEATLDRSVLWRAQTPQGFRADLLRELLDEALRENYRPTDDAALHERYRGPISLVEGGSENIKLTTPRDLALAESIFTLRGDTPIAKPDGGRLGETGGPPPAGETAP